MNTFDLVEFGGRNHAFTEGKEGCTRKVGQGEEQARMRAARKGSEGGGCLEEHARRVAKEGSASVHGVRGGKDKERTKSLRIV